MSSRVTRSSARPSAGTSSENPPNHPVPPPSHPSPASSRKRKSTAAEINQEQPNETGEIAPTRTGRAKRTKVEPESSSTAPPTRSKKAKGKAAMSSSGYVRAGEHMGHALTENRPSTEPVVEKSSRRGKGGRKSSGQGNSSWHRSGSLPHTERRTDAPSMSRRSSRKSAKADEDTNMDDAPENKSEDEPQTPADEHTSEDGNDGGPGTRYDDDDDDDDDDDEDPFTSGFLGRNPHHSLSALRQLTGLMSGNAQRLRSILEQLKSPDVSLQLIALQDLSEVLLMATEDTLAGHFSPDAYVKELVKLMQPNDFTGEENPEVMLLSCRCLANLMEALPAATANVVYGGAVPVLCSKLLEIDFIDLAEQSLSTLEKISVEFPASIVREGGLTACLTFLDFFATSTQRTAVTTAANCCRNIPEDSFCTIRDVMPILENILNNSDQKVVEQGCICVSRIVQSFRHQEDKLEELVSPGLLKAILALLLPGTTNLIGPHIHTMFLQVLAYTAKASPSLSVELLKMNVVDTLYQILTGVSPPSGTEDVAAKIDSVVIMQALIHRPKDQVFETLNVICELLPDVANDGLSYLQDLFDAGYPGRDRPPLSSESKKTSNEKRVELFEDCKTEVKRFAVILLPTLTDAYSSTVNLNVRQKVLTAQLKMLSNLDTDILEEALRTVPYASFLASIFSQQDHPTLVTYALQAAELLLKRLESIYRYQFYREGVIAEISLLANRPSKSLEVRTKDSKPTVDNEVIPESSASTTVTGDRGTEPFAADPMDVETHSDEDGGEEDGDDDDDDDDDDDGDEDRHVNGDEHDDEDDSDSSSSSGQHALPLPNIDDVITLRAKKFIEVHEKDSDKPIRDKASAVLDDLKSLAKDLEQCTLQGSPNNCAELFARLATYFEGDALESITSYELKSSKIVDVLLELFSTDSSASGADLRALFLESFMGTSNKNKIKTASSASPATPFSVLVNKLQDLLSRSEHFEVITVHQNSYDGRGSAANMLAKQLRLKLVAEDDSGIPKSYRNIMVSIHAIATFKALDDYLRPRMHIAAERPRGSRTRDHFAAYAQALAEGRAPPPPDTPSETTRSSKRTPKSKSKSNEDPEAGPSSTSREKTRRSSRRQQTQPPPPPPPPPAPTKAHSSSSQDPLECADEQRLSDQESMDANAALNAIVDELEEELENELEDALDNDESDPSAVSVEVASTGKATARKEDGTRIATPIPGTPSSKPSDRLSTPASRLTALLQDSAMRQSLGAASSALSYAAAVQSTPQDWHIEFSVNDQPISSETTIYRVVHFNQAQASDVSQRTVWNAVHTIKFKRVAGPPPGEGSSQTPPPETKIGGQTMPASLDNHPVTSGILRLLNLLHGLNSHLDDILSENKDQIRLNAEPLSQFVNTKLTAKLNRQLEEPLIVASNCLPSWSEDLARFYPFLFPFESRHLFVQSTSFGYSRCMTRWQNTQNANDTRNDRHRDERPFLGRLQRQKVRISRSRILESAMKVMQLYGHSPSVLEVEYFEEVGTGLGPTLEFYSTVSREFSKKKLRIWRENDSISTDEYAFGKRGLFPAPMSAQQAASDDGEKKLEMFKVLGKFVARSMLDSRIIDVSFNPTLFRLSDSSSTVITPSLATIRTVDEDLAKSLRLLKSFADAKKQVDDDQSKTDAQKTEAAQSIRFQNCTVDDMALDFTLPGYPSIELIENGAHTTVTIDNVGLYVERVLDLTLGSGVKHQIDAFSAGFSEVFPYSALKAFTPDELVMLFGRNDEDWSLESTSNPYLIRIRLT